MRGLNKTGEELSKRLDIPLITTMTPNVQWDHIIPVSIWKQDEEDGINCWQNLRLLPDYLNNAKKDKLFLDQQEEDDFFKSIITVKLQK